MLCHCFVIMEERQRGRDFETGPSDTKTRFPMPKIYRSYPCRTKYDHPLCLFLTLPENQAGTNFSFDTLLSVIESYINEKLRLSEIEVSKSPNQLQTDKLADFSDCKNTVFVCSFHLFPPCASFLENRMQDAIILKLLSQTKW